MGEPAPEKLLRKSRILVAPLDWGLGHTTRCIPIIKELLANHCDVWLAGESTQEAVLRLEFPELPFLSLQGYRVEYSKAQRGLPWKMLQQMPKLMSAIKREHSWLQRTISNHSFDAVISDNRFGLHHSEVPSIFITHQLSIQSGIGKWSKRVLQRWNYRYINQFTECWVPDLPGEDNLGGELSHPLTKPRIPVKYIGVLSRFEKEAVTRLTLPASEESNNHLLFIISGPEPQRSILENKIINEISHYPYTATIVRGVPASLSVIPSTSMIKFYNHLPAFELSEEMAKAAWVICRCGYSTIMDLVKMQKKSILIPTPGQTEQEYLARYVHKKQLAVTIQQDNFSIETALGEAERFNYQIPDIKGSGLLKDAINSFLRI